MRNKTKGGASAPPERPMTLCEVFAEETNQPRNDMTNMPGNRRYRGNCCAICGKNIRGYYQWLCKDHRTSEWVQVANDRLEQKRQERITTNQGAT